MEQDLAILIADLSGYTALTETHGAHAAADLIDTYMELVDRSLVGECRLQERTGDEVLILSPSADQLFDTAMELLYQTSATSNFLHIHGGLHFGPLLQRRNAYFGPAINLASRIAAQAPPGSFYSSKEFIGALQQHKKEYRSKGSMELRNIHSSVDLYELNPPLSHQPVDPVCRMLLGEHRIAHPTIENLFFCSPECLATYLERTAEVK